MSFEVTGVLRIVDEASRTVEEASSNIQSSLGKVEEASSQVSESTRQADFSARQLVTGFSGVATSAFSLYNAYDRVADMQVTVDRANLQVQTSLNALEDAQRRYNAAVEKYGEESEQASAALKDVQLAQERYNLSVERAQMVQGNLNEAMVQSALTVIPSLITMVSSLSTVKASWAAITGAATAAQNALSGALTFLAANPIVLVAAAIAGIIAALWYAYNNCEWFRNAVNELGRILGEFFAPIVDAVVKGLTWLWNNVLVPLGQFVAGYFIGVWQSLCLIWEGLNAAVSAVHNGLKWLWDNILVPLANFLIGSLFSAISGVMSALDWLNRHIVKPLSDALTWLWKNVMEPLANFIASTFKPVFDAVSAGLKPLVDGVNWLGNSLRNLCFRHAAPMAAVFNEEVSEGIRLTDALAGNVEGLAGGLRGLSGGFGVTVPSEAMNPATSTSQTLVLSPTINVSIPEGSPASQDPRGFAETVYEELSAIVRRELRSQTFFVAR